MGERSTELREEVRRLATMRGFAFAGFARAVELPDDLARLERWLGDGHHGAMEWMAKEAARRADVRASLPSARTVVMLATNYYNGDVVEPSPGPEWGRVARYARGRDYHDLIGGRLEDLAADLAAQLAAEKPARSLAWRPFVDASPLLERAYAERAGLGFVGKNTCLIRPGTGSWFFLAALAIDLDLPPDDPIDGTCGRCTRCLDACPTQAFPVEGVLDARRCISYLTIEWRGPIGDRTLERGLGDWVFGCDVCQDVCPYNKEAEPTADPALQGPAFVDLRDLLAIRSNEEFNSRFAGSPIQRARRRGLQRSAALALENSLAEAGRSADAAKETVAAQLQDLATAEAESPELRASLLAVTTRLRNPDPS